MKHLYERGYEDIGDLYKMADKYLLEGYRVFIYYGSIVREYNR